MTNKEQKRLLDRAAKLKPKPELLPSGRWRCRVMVGGEKASALGDPPEDANAKALAMKAGLVEISKKKFGGSKGSHHAAGGD